MNDVPTSTDVAPEVMQSWKLDAEFKAVWLHLCAAQGRGNETLERAYNTVLHELHGERARHRQRMERLGLVAPHEPEPQLPPHAGTTANEKSWSNDTGTWLAHGPGPEAIRAKPQTAPELFDHKSRREAMRVPERLSDDDKTPTGPEAA